MKRIGVLLSVATVLAAACSGGGDGSSTKEPIKIGVLGSETGFLGQLGIPMNEAIRFYFENERGGEIAGRKIELVFADDASDATTGLTQVKQLIERDKIDILIGPMDTPIAFAVRSYVESKRIPWILHVGDAYPSDQAPSEYAFKTAPTNRQNHLAMGQYAFNKLGYRNVIMVALDYEPGHQVADGFTRGFEAAGGQIVDTVLLPFDADPAPFITKILGEIDGVDAVNASLWSPAAIPFVTAARELGLMDKVDVIGMGSLAADKLELDSEKDAALGVKTYYHWMLYNDIPANETFVAAFNKQFGHDPNVFHYFGYVAAEAVGHGIEAANGNIEDTNGFLKALSSVQFDSPGGPFAFDTYRVVITTVWVAEIQNVGGEFRNVVVDSIPNVDQFYQGIYKPLG